MKNYRCQCGNYQVWGSMPPMPCTSCNTCGTQAIDADLALSHAQSPHPRPPQPHRWVTESVDSDNGPQPWTHCSMCGKPADSVIAALAELMNAIGGVTISNCTERFARASKNARDVLGQS